MKKRSILLLIVITLTAVNLNADCPSADLTGDCFVDFEDFAVLAGQWKTGYDITDLSAMADQWIGTDPDLPDDLVYIPDHEFEMGDTHGDDGWPEIIHTVFVDAFFMNRYETTNQQYCDYLNSAYDANDLKVVEDGPYWDVYAATDVSENYPYYQTHATRIDFDDTSETFSVGTKGSTPRDVSNDPVGSVSWCGAAAYCNWLSVQTGKASCYNLSTWECNLSAHGYRLPTEAQWEHAARGGHYNPYYRFPWGDTISHILANHYADSNAYPYDVNPPFPYFGYHPDWEDGDQPYSAPVGSFLANGFGLYDMSGNASEWCNDWFDGMYYYNCPYENPPGPATGTYRINRGGAYGASAPGCRVSVRSYEYPYFRRIYIGFRVVLNLD